MASATETLGSIVDAVSYTSDSTGQLLSTTPTSPLRPGEGEGEGPSAESYIYDPNGNRTTANGGTYVTGPDNELLSDGTYSYQYDADGNRIARWIPGGSGETAPGQNAGDTNTTVYTWDNRDRLTSVTSYATDAAYTAGTPDQTVTYIYDAFNRWIGETIIQGGTTTQTRYVYDGNQIVVEFDGSASPLPSGEGQGEGSQAAGLPLTAANLSHRYLWGEAVDQLMADEQLNPLPPGEGGGEGGSGGGSGGYNQSTPGTTVWSLTDNENTVRDLAVYSAASGTSTVVNHRVFSAYGQLLSQTNPSTSPASAAAVDCLFGYTGRAFDKASGEQYNDNRWYDAVTGRWLSQDPVPFWRCGQEFVPLCWEQAGSGDGSERAGGNDYGGLGPHRPSGNYN